MVAVTLSSRALLGRCRLMVAGLGGLLLLAVPGWAAFSAEKLALVDRPFQGELAALSPDGKYLALTSYDGARPMLTVLGLDGHTRRDFPLEESAAKPGKAPRLAQLRWVSGRLVLVNSDADIVSLDPDGGNRVRLWAPGENGLVTNHNFLGEAYHIVAHSPRIHPPLVDHPGQVLIESVATIGPESFSNAFRVDVRTGRTELVNGGDFRNGQIALYGRGDMLMWPSWPLVNGTSPRSLEEMEMTLGIPPPVPKFAEAPVSMADTPYARRLRIDRALLGESVWLRGAETPVPENIRGPLSPDTGAAVLAASSATGRMLYDRQGNPRLLYTEPTSGAARDFLYTEAGKNPLLPNVIPPTLGERLGEPKSREFTLSADNYFGERAYPLGFDFDPQVLYYASNVGRDTYGIYALNLKTKQRTELAPDLQGIDLATGDPEDTAGILVFDESRRKLVGIRYTSVKPRTYWLDPEFAELQAGLNRRYPRHGVEILGWDDTRDRLLVRIAAEDDPGGLMLFRRREDRLEEIAPSAPWLAGAALNPATSFVFQTPAGVVLSGYLTLPDQPKVKPPPLLIYLQASLWDRAAPGFNREADMLADMGIAVMRLNYRGSPGFGRKHLTAIQEGIDTIPSEDLLAAVNWAKDHLKVDLKRVMIMGESLGGYMALLALQLHPDVFRCGISLNAPTSLAGWSGWQRIQESGPMYWKGTVETTATVDFRSAVRGAFVAGIRRNARPSGNPRTPDGMKPALLVIESFGSGETTPLSSFLAGIGLGGGGTDVSRLEINGDFQGGTPATRTKVFTAIENFLNENLYEYKATIGELKVLEDAAPGKKQ